MSWLKKIGAGLKKTSSKITAGLTKQKVSDDLIDELYDRLIMADVGTEAADKIIKKFSKAKFGKDVTAAEITDALANEIADILQPFQGGYAHTNNPSVVLVCGVNGNVKTTTIGKLAAKDIECGKKVLLAACDTFRAAAADQLEVWAKRNNCGFISAEPNADPASVAYKAVVAAHREEYDVLYLDTAGRLQNNKDLMAELGKIKRAIIKADSSAPHNTLMILDATTGQNAISQLENFSKAVDISGLVVTKLDGTAKGGILIALALQFKTSVFFIGVGEQIADLQLFNAKEYATALMGQQAG